MDLQSLPDDPAALKSIIFELNNKIRLKDKEIVSLEEAIIYLQRKKFAPQSEKYKDQINYFNELEGINPADAISEEADTETNIPAHKRKKRGKRAPLSADLPRVEEIIDLTEEQKEGMKCIGEEVTEELVIEPAKVYVKKIIRKKYAPIESSDVSTIVTAPMPARLISKSFASASLVAYIIIAKYCDALPLYRQEKIFARISASITRQTMARWLIKVSELLVPLYNLMQDRLLASGYIQMDETTVQVLKEKNRKPTTKSYMWVRYCPGDKPIILYDYDPSRSSSVPMELLNGFSGHLQVDGYDGYAPACQKYNLTRVGCWDHARRKFYDAFKTSGGKGVGKKALDRIKKLYKIEKEIKPLSPEQRLKVRQEKSLPILAEFKQWIDEQRIKTTPSSSAGKALNYAFNEWPYLFRYTEDGKINISNARVENAIRPFCVGRKNWLFSSSTEGAKASAMFYSLIQTAIENGLEPFDYFNKMLDKLPHAQTVEDYEQLLPLKGQFLV